MTASSWRTSSSSAERGDCVDVVLRPVRVRDTTDRTSGSPTFGPAQWQAFLTAIARSKVSEGKALHSV
jgi:hypothetical protein